MTQIPIKKETIDKIDQQNKIANPGKASIREITDKLYFDYGMDEAPEALYSEMIPGGYVSVTRNPNHYDSKISIEVLFNTVMKNKETIKQIFG